MDVQPNTTSTPTIHDAQVVKPTLRERATSALKSVRVGATTVVVVGGVVIAGGAYWLYQKTQSTPTPTDAQE